MRIRLILTLIILLTPLINYSQCNNWAIGLKFNNPKGITLKKYYGNKAFELILGRPSPWKFKNFYNSSNYNYNLLNHGYTLVGNDNQHHPWSIQAHYLIHKNINLIPGLSWYYGIGGQIRTVSNYYNYLFNNGVTFDYVREKKVYWGIGADFVGGMEYSFKSIPFTIFYDLTYYVEAINHPLYMKLQGGLGLRYYF